MIPKSKPELGRPCTTLQQILLDQTQQQDEGPLAQPTPKSSTATISPDVLSRAQPQQLRGPSCCTARSPLEPSRAMQGRAEEAKYDVSKSFCKKRTAEGPHLLAGS